MMSTLPLAALDDAVSQAAYTEWRSDASGRRCARSRLRISGMHCAACAGLVEGALVDIPGVIEARASAGTARLLLQWDPQQVRLSSLQSAVRAAGYGLLPDLAASAHEERQREQRQALWRLFVAAFCMMQVMMLTTPLYVAAPGEMPADQQHLLNWGSWLLTLPVLVFSAGGFFSGAWRQFRQRRIGMDVPVAVAIAVTFVASTGAAFDPQGLFGGEVYFDSLTMFVCLLLGGRLLEQRARHRVASVLEDSVDRLPAVVQRLGPEGVVHTVAPGQLCVGDHIRVPVGEAFPADGVLLEGATRADEALLTGESQPQAKAVGAVLVAGSLNVDAPVTMRVDRVGAETRYEAIVALMSQALLQRPRLLRSADRIAGPFLWGVLLLAAGAAAVWSLIDPARAVWVAMSVLIVTCPCALSLAAPSALLAATGALARRGLLLQRLDALEALARMRYLFIDKTGTLTEDCLELVQVTDGQGQVLEAGLALTRLRQAASLAGWSTHPLSRALVLAAGNSDGVCGRPVAGWHKVEERPGSGLQAVDEQGRVMRLGSTAWVGVQGTGDGMNRGDDDAGLGLWFGPAARQGQAAAIDAVHFEFRETLRADAQAAVAALQREGIQVSLLSGDNPARVAAVAQRLGLDGARGGASPEDKLAALVQRQSQGEIVGMVGDGLNDAPVLARADVSLAMGQGALVSRQRADAVVLSMRLADIAHARVLARRTITVIRQNLAWAVIYNAVCIPLALAGALPPWVAGLGMATSSLVVVLNSLRLSRRLD